jgi:hypothetical protein
MQTDLDMYHLNFNGEMIVVLDFENIIWFGSIVEDLCKS